MSGIIDVHHHIMEPLFLAMQQDRIRRTGYSQKVMEWTPSASIEEMGQVGAAGAILSVSAPGCWTGKVDESRRLARVLNEYKARLVRDYPGRFGFFATLPLPDADGSLKELEYAFDTLKADGVCLLTNYDGKYPGDPAFAPVYDELNRRKAIVYSHPAAVDCCVNMQPGVPMAILEFMFDNTRAIVSLLAGGTFTRCPDIRFIFSHCGGALPAIAGRIHGWSNSLGDKAPKGALPELKRLNFDTASMCNPVTFAALLKLVPATQVFFGSDFPWGMMATSKNPLRTALGLSAEDVHAIEEGNARRMFERFKG
jgi:predicted TIM-barrel fold metal-dependent hydrolase